MPYQAYLPQAGGAVANARAERSTPAWPVVLTLLLGLLFCLPGVALACSPQFERVELAPEVPGQEGEPRAGWQPVTLPDLWNRRGSDFDGTVWYRLAWRGGCKGQPLALSVDHMVMSGQVFLNGDLLWQDERQARSWNMPRYWLLPASLLGEHNTLSFRLSSSQHPGPGLGNVRLGPPEQIMPLYQAQHWQQRGVFIVNLSVSLVISVLFVVLWLVRRSEQAFGWFALASLAWSLGISNILLTSAWPFENGVMWDRLSLLALVLYGCAFCRFTWAFGGMCFPRLALALWGGSAVMWAWVLLVPETQLSTLQVAMVLGYWLLLMFNCLQLLLRAWRTRLPSHLLLGLGLLSFLLVSLYQGTHYLQLVEEGPGYLSLATPIISICMFLIVAWRFEGNMRRIEAFNDELQAVVKNTREDLTDTLNREHRLAAANIRLNERLRMPHDLHDSLGSSLMRSIAWVEQARGMAQEQFLAMLKELRGDLRHVIDGASGGVALVSETPGAWLAPLRHRFGRLFDELGLASDWRFPPQWPHPLSAMQQLALTRFVEEALTNVIKHSRAGSLEVALEALPEGGMSLRVTDNGEGFDVQGTLQSGQGIGMQSMRARIERIGGQLSIDSRRGCTSLQVTLRPTE